MTTFADRHIGPEDESVHRMLEAVGYPSLDALIDEAVPESIRQDDVLVLPPALTEGEALAALERFAHDNVQAVQMIGQGYYDTVTPAVIRRGILSNPAWYTAYTPYQAEISQGRLEAMLNFQTMVSDLTALPYANASLLDEATAVGEAVLMMQRAGGNTGAVVLDAECFPQTLEVALAQASALGIDVRVETISEEWKPAADVTGVVIQNPGMSGALRDLRPLIERAHAAGALVTVACDILSLTIVTPPGEMGADIAVGSAQRFGVPLFYGGPHAAFIAVREGLERQLPGRLVGVSVDAVGNPAYRLTLQTREQHIRRDKATSNICTAQALLAVVASMYAVYHGPDGLRDIAMEVHSRAVTLYDALTAVGFQPMHEAFFDTITVSVPHGADSVVARAAAAGINIRKVDDDRVAIACDEKTELETLDKLVEAVIATKRHPVYTAPRVAIPRGMRRTSEYLTHPVFTAQRSEAALTRYMRRLADRDLALDRTMIPLGSCTMKLNAAAEMEPILWPGFANIHPFAPANQTAGYRHMIEQLEDWLAEITGYAAVSVQPNAGSRGEYAGLLAIRNFHLSRGEIERDICLIPDSAHGTNAASAVLAGFRVVVVRTAADGEIDMADLTAKLTANSPKIAAIMITYPSTHGVYEPHVKDVCAAVHDAGGQVYIDGANLNALVGLAKPGHFGGDVSHLNLHKTFAIPHGGGGPGVGPVAVAEHLVEFLPAVRQSIQRPRDLRRAGAAVSAAPYGSAGVLPIAWAYIAMLGGDGLRQTTQMAVLAANYVAVRLDPYFPVLYRGPGGLVAHECILDLRELTKTTGVTAEDVAKRLIDYGIHAPTMSWPVAGTLMVEPTESEDLTELDRFVDAMISIRGEIDAVASGEVSADDSVLRHAPHTAEALAADEWVAAYSRETAAFPVPGLRRDKYFSPVRRIDNAYGDRNLVCTCPPVEHFED
ncbi:aminomethyl-transferring glycine dehydrogenase [Demequina sp. TTPB684]|uniref:aminomethyl-transferring glycine dehydrogenase n=1 Tax=unclassified Demequina TaxID=2620311 RepID=UPI001CF3F674|nr:aminomethyl-transferring glycine dehydrogenase [Demequina sp. TMPB413]MCB2412722.1 aminomethyl-transferring glycine dehydrogenase [Demequina sp. TTPB684]